MAITLDRAREIASIRLRALEAEMHAFGSAVPGYSSRPKPQLIVTREEEHDFGWVFFYKQEVPAQDDGLSVRVGGNTPFIVDRTDGSMHSTGVARPLTHYLDEYRKQRPHRA